jgi:ABC-type polysaccharide/polyol phosphate export permease
LYVSGVLFSVDSAIDNDTIRQAFALNPFYALVAAIRWSMIATPTSGAVGWSVAIWTLVVLFGGFAWFRRGEHRYGA